ncbi:MAG: putative rane protein [Deltaproteobacteria bacterium]|nr:putative rane protein [Deltaproteobacteria bacterium]
MRRIPLALVLVSSISLAAPRYELDGNQLKVPHPVIFESGKPALKPEAAEAISYVRGYLDDKPYVSLLRVEVHSDSTGTEKFNQVLSEQRALAVAKALVAQGIDCKRLIAVGFGSTKPVADNSTPEGKAQNRRTVFANVQLRGRNIGGQPSDGGGHVAGDPCH